MNRSCVACIEEEQEEGREGEGAKVQLHCTRITRQEQGLMIMCVCVSLSPKHPWLGEGGESEGVLGNGCFCVVNCHAL